MIACAPGRLSVQGNKSNLLVWRDNEASSSWVGPVLSKAGGVAWSAIEALRPRGTWQMLLPIGRRSVRGEREYMARLLYQ